ncbi:MAG: low molecular weight protein arginine phosphatase [Acidimicrobiia bacterium]|nr:low molecular weight protein arginine phosphatase [Acidimicrobiia bacterium]
MLPATILFVCTGNICRSPLAEAVARRALVEWFRVPDLSEIGLHTASAGTLAVEGRPATPEMRQVAGEIGLDLSTHRSSQLSPQAIADASLILAMEAHHLHWLRSHRAEAPAGLLGASDIDDPYGLGLPEYRRARQEITAAVELHLPELIGLAY